MIEFERFVFSPFCENTYLIWDKDTREAAVIDPGCYDDREEEQFSRFVKNNSLKLIYLINTHCHIDHVFGNAFIKNNYNVVFLAPEEDMPLLEHVPEQAELFGVEFKLSPKPDEFITEDVKLKLGNSEGTFLFTPGHTPGEYSLYFEEDKICFTGDVLFQEGIGRTDLPGGDYKTLINSIRSKLFTLPDFVSIYPGHGDKSDIGHEKRINPFLT